MTAAWWWQQRKKNLEFNRCCRDFIKPSNCRDFGIAVLAVLFYCAVSLATRARFLPLAWFGEKADKLERGQIDMVVITDLAPIAEVPPLESEIVIEVVGHLTKRQFTLEANATTS